MRQLQLGRTMLETIMAMAIMGILSVTGIYMYKDVMNGVRADAIIKDVLLRASQIKGNDDLNHSGVGKKMVYTPEYKKNASLPGDPLTTKGRYGYSYQIIDACTNAVDTACAKRLTKKISNSEYAVVKLNSVITPAVCDAVKGKLETYGDRYPKVVCMYNSEDVYIDTNVANCKANNVNIIKESGEHLDCSNTDLSILYFTVQYG